MQWFEHFATEGLILPAFLVAFGSLVVLRASSTPMPTDAQLNATPGWMRWLARKNSEKLQRRSGWAIIAVAIIIAIVRISII